VSSLWTPEGERPVGRPAEPAPPPDVDDRGPGAVDPDVAERLEVLRRELLSAPAEVVVANHAYGLFELAALHLGEQPPHLESARLAVDALAALVDGLTGRLGEAGEPLREALAQIRLAYVQIAQAAGGDGADAPPA